MVSELQFFERDPMYPRMDRGRGWYYFRGNLTTGLLGARRQNPVNQRGPYWSFYSKNKKAGSSKDGTRPSLPTHGRKGVNYKEEHAPHKGDYKTRQVQGEENIRRKGIRAAGTGTGRTPEQRRHNPPKYINRNMKRTRGGEGRKGYY